MIRRFYLILLVCCLAGNSKDMSIRSLYQLSGDIEGSPLQADRRKEGRSIRIIPIADFASIAEGSQLRIYLLGGQERFVHVILNKLDLGAPGVRALSAGFPKNNGGFSLYQNLKKHQLAGRIWMMDNQVAYLVRTRADNSVWMTEVWKATIIAN